MSSSGQSNAQRLRRYVFELALTCGHCVTVAVDGWYPVSVACCDRLGGTILRGDYVAFSSAVEYASLVSEDTENGPVGASANAGVLLRRQSRTDSPRCRRIGGVMAAPAVSQNE